MIKDHGAASDLEERIEAVLGGAPAAIDAAAAVREVFGEAEKAEAPEDEDAESDPKAEREALIKALKKVIKAIKAPRYQRKPPAELTLAAILAGEHSPGSIYHFLLPDPGMSPFDNDKAVKELVPKAVETLKKWRKSLGAKFKKGDAERLVMLSRQIDALLARRAEERRDALAVSRSPVTVWGQEAPAPPPGNWRSIEGRMQAHRLARAPGRAYHTLKQVMDLWAAQWAWPLEHADSLPTREAWWSRVEELLGVEHVSAPLSEQLELLPLHPDADSAVVDSGASATAAIERLTPFHWWLEFPEVSAASGGFDLVVGNPPWIKLQWNEQGILGDIDPKVVLDGASAASVASRRAEILGANLPVYLADFEGLEGTKGFLNAEANYPLLKGVQTNLYKCFFEQAWRLGRHGVVGLIHQDGIFDDSRGGVLRRAFFERLHYAFRFKNQLMLFAEVYHRCAYCLAITSTEPHSFEKFTVGANFFHPRTIDSSFEHEGLGRVPGLKNEWNEFDTRGHRSRLVEIGRHELSTFASLFDPLGTPLSEARIPVVHSREVLNVLAKLARHPRRLSDIGDAAFATQMWHETNAQKDGTIRRETRFPRTCDEWIVSGPQIYVGNPLNKSPASSGRNKADYDLLDLYQLAEDYMPRTNYVPACPISEYLDRIPKFDGKPTTAYFRHAHRRMIAPVNERSLIAAVLPPGPGHIHPVVSVSFRNNWEMLCFNALSQALILDFMVRSKGAADMSTKAVGILPVPRKDSPLTSELVARSLRLACLTRLYQPLWDAICRQLQRGAAWSHSDSRLSSWEVTDSSWSRLSALRSAFERRQALVEIDALAALEFEISIDELCTIYRTQFPVLYDYENHTWYDAKGRIAFTNNRGLAGVGLKRQDFEAWQKALEAGEPTPTGFDTLGLVPPFDRCDREEDMRRAYFFFADKLGIDIPENREE